MRIRVQGLVNFETFQVSMDGLSVAVGLSDILQLADDSDVSCSVGSNGRASGANFYTPMFL